MISATSISNLSDDDIKYVASTEVNAKKKALLFLPFNFKSQTIKEQALWWSALHKLRKTEYLSSIHLVKGFIFWVLLAIFGITK
ncbi:hypothetical protein RCL_jg22522.t1 [Rhizophagus clarus]|uniref:Uncharacterized protein n=1 Tax=Rhizophagus clarus TaxID=94130 RepID=A0A8H3MIQ9_9GLOM|nr:hypothetical protein RCL_jg22522.t1 [Rhizophagus clarus]